MSYDQTPTLLHRQVLETASTTPNEPGDDMKHQISSLSDFDIHLSSSQEVTFMDPALYLAPEVYDVDVERIFPDAWVVVADVNDLASPGQWACEHVGDRHVLIQRATNGELLALSAGPCRAMAGGSPTNVPDNEVAAGGAVCEVIAHQETPNVAAMLTTSACDPADLDVWERFLFVNPSRTAGPLLDYLAPLPELLRGHDIAKQQSVVSFTHQSASNWKLLVDNGFCDYHVPFVHERLMPLIEGPDTWGQELAPNVTILTAALTEAGLEGQPLYSGIVSRGDPALVNLSMAMGIYPNVLLLGFRTGAVHLITWWPTGIASTQVRVRTYDHKPPSDDDVRYGAASVELLQREDIGICELVQQGLASSSYRPGPRHRLETRVFGFHQRYLAALEAAIDSP